MAVERLPQSLTDEVDHEPTLCAGSYSHLRRNEAMLDPMDHSAALPSVFSHVPDLWRLTWLLLFDFLSGLAGPRRLFLR